MSDIFVSYASEDRARIMPLVHALEATGWSVFWDRTIPVGGTWQQVIGAEIEACRCMVVIWSAISINKEWVYEEAAEGRRRGVLAPVLVDDILPPIGFRSIQAANLVEWVGDTKAPEFRRLIADLTVLLGEPPAEIEAGRVAAEEETRRAEAEAQRKAEEDERRRAEEEEKKRAEEDERQRAEELRRKAEEQEAQKRAEEAAKEEQKKPGVKNLPWIMGSIAIVIIAAVLLYTQHAKKDSQVGESLLAITDAQVRNFVDQYIGAQNRGDVSELLQLYDDQVRYFDKGTVGKDFILRDKQNYYRRWPEVENHLTSGISIDRSVGHDTAHVSFAISFNVRNPVRGDARSGTARNDLQVRWINGKLRITSEQQRVTSRQND
jgi:hypothetical protein